jgi:phosphatidylinositol glycan class T
MLFFLPLLLLFASSTTSELFEEQLSLKELGNSDILADLRFTITFQSTNGGSAEELDHVPWVVRNIFDKYDLATLHISLTQGFWRSNLWGNQPQPQVPTGATFFARFNGNATIIDERWNSLVNLFNGMFCTSFLDMHPTMTSSPSLLFGKEQDGQWRYGASSGEPVCTENFKPWKQMLPCKRDGFVALLEPRHLYSANFHSIFLHAERKADSSWSLQLGSNVVVDAKTALLGDKSWTIYSVFGKKLLEKCVVAETSKVFVDTPANRNVTPSADKSTTCDGRILNEYIIDSDFKGPFALKVKRSSEDTTGTPIEEGPSIHTFAQNTNQNGGTITSRLKNFGDNAYNGVYVHMIPWNIRIFTHTISYKCDTTKITPTPQITNQKFSLAKDRIKPLLMEFAITLPAQSSCQISFHYETAHMRLNEYPPDSNNGVYMPGPTVVLKKLGNTAQPKDCQPQRRISLVKEADTVLHGEPLLVLLPVPDFSMPFNVLCFVCTIIAFFFGPVHTMTTRIFVPLPANMPATGLTLAGFKVIDAVKLKLHYTYGWGKVAQPPTNTQ